MLALRHPELVDRLCVVDVSPVDYGDGRRLRGRTSTRCRASTWPRSRSRAEADAALTEAVPNPTVRGFLLQNLRRDGDGWRWQVNLDVLGRELAEVSGWPEERRRRTRRRTPGRCCGSPGATSAYVQRRVRRRDGPAGSRGSGGWSSRTPGTGCTPSSPRSFLEVLRRFVDWTVGLRPSAWRPGRRRPRLRLPQVVLQKRRRPVAGQVEHHAFAVVVGADAEPGHLVGADHVDHRHRGLDRRSGWPAARRRRRRAGASRRRRGGPAGGRALARRASR